MPAKSKAQANLMRAAEHGANFPMARKVRASMTLKQMHDFAAGSDAGKPAHVKKRTGHPAKNLGHYLHKSKKRGSR
jgi:hypothetical protein